MHTQSAVLRTHSVWPLVIVCLVDASELVPSLVVARSLLPLARIPDPPPQPLEGHILGYCLVYGTSVCVLLRFETMAV